MPGADDFVLPLDPGAPDWHASSVVYEIFPDRFASSGAERELPDWAVPRAWDGLPEGRSRDTSRELFGGDLPGIEQRLDHVESLGANVLYLTPFFPAGSTHRYDATSFDRVDPLLGGDEALRSLLRAAHGRGLRVVGDLTLNHCGAGHDWFRAAQAYPARPSGGSSPSTTSSMHGYASWLGVASLPKLNWAEPELRRRMVEVFRRWLRRGTRRLADRRREHGRPPRALRRQRRGRPLGARARRRRAAPRRARPRLPARPAGRRLARRHELRRLPAPGLVVAARRTGRTSSTSSPRRRLPATGAGRRSHVMRAFRAGVPWDCAANSWTLLDSHDTPRFRTVAGSRERQLVGVGLQMTTPGVPMVFAGDELGLEGEWGEDARRTMPWDRTGDLGTAVLAEYRKLIALRRSSDALARGGIRYVHVSDDAIAYLRESASERLLCLAARAPHDPIAAPFELETLYGDDAASGVLPSHGPAFHVWRINDG